MRYRRVGMARWIWAVILAGPLVPWVSAQAPDPATEPPAAPRRHGPLHRLFHHTAATLEDKFIGYPDAFIEPPLGSYVRRQFTVQVAKADPHRWTLYHSDFLPGTDRFSPIGASRLNLMVARGPGSAGPFLIEWTPDRPELAEARRLAVLAALGQAGRPIPADRVVIGPSPYPGAMGVEALGLYGNIVGRSQAAAQTFPLSPTVSANMGVR
jgi:hypothetical protein